MTIDEAKEEIKRRINLREFAISHGIKHHSGSLFHSPFRTDKTPSFGITDKSGIWIWKDFSEQGSEPSSGDIISYVEKLKNCSFIEAVKYLAAYCGIEVTTGAPRLDQQRTGNGNRLKLKPEYKAIETGSKLFTDYRDKLLSSGATKQEADKLALIEVKHGILSDIVSYCAASDYSERLKEYLEGERFITTDTAGKFFLFEIRDITGLKTLLRDKYDNDTLKLSGVLNENGYWNIERGRVYIPYTDQGKYTYLKGRYIPQSDRHGNASIISQFEELTVTYAKMHRVTMDQAINSIRTGVYKTGTGTTDIKPVLSQIRALAAQTATAMDKETLDQLKENKRKLKSTLPVFVFAGEFIKRAAEALKKYEGIIVIDIDHITGDIQELKREISNDPYTYAVFISPSGDGLKTLVKLPLIGDTIDGVIYHHGTAFDALKQYYNFRYSVEIDKRCRDLARCCFGSYDPEIYVNEGSRLFDVFVPKYKQIGNSRAGLKLFNLDALNEAEGGEVYLTAGEFDTIILSQIGFHSVSLFKDDEPLPPEALNILKRFTVRILIDNDQSGNRRAAQVMGTLTRAGIIAERLELPEGMDVTDFIKQLLKGKQ